MNLLKPALSALFILSASSSVQALGFCSNSVIQTVDDAKQFLIKNHPDLAHESEFETKDGVTVFCMHNKQDGSKSLYGFAPELEQVCYINRLNPERECPPTYNGF